MLIRGVYFNQITFSEIGSVFMENLKNVIEFPTLTSILIFFFILFRGFNLSNHLQHRPHFAFAP